MPIFVENLNFDILLYTCTTTQQKETRWALTSTNCAEKLSIVSGKSKNDFSENDKVRNLLKARKSAEVKGGRMENSVRKLKSLLGNELSMNSSNSVR